MCPSVWRRAGGGKMSRPPILLGPPGVLQMPSGSVRSRNMPDTCPAIWQRALSREWRTGHPQHRDGHRASICSFSTTRLQSFHAPSRTYTSPQLLADSAACSTPTFHPPASLATSSGTCRALMERCWRWQSSSSAISVSLSGRLAQREDRPSFLAQETCN